VPTLTPFRAVRYSEKNQKNIGSLFVADLDTAEHLWGNADSSLSFRNLLVGPPEQRSQIWQAWLSSGDLELVDDPAFYVLSQEFSDTKGRKSTRWAAYGSADVLAEKILTHENVLPEGVERARQSTEACEGDVAPLFASLNENDGIVLRNTLQELCRDKKRLVQYRDSAGLEVCLWKISEPADVQSIQRIIGEGNLYLLDGHHRLAAAKANIKAGLGDGRILVCVCSMDAEDILIYPIHRLVYCERWMLPGIAVGDLVEAGCRVSPIVGRSPREIEAALAEVERIGHPAAIMLHAHEDRLQEVSFGAASSLPQVLQSLSVARLDLEVLKDIKCSIIPTADLNLALEQLAQDQVQVAFFLPAVKQDQVRAAANAGITLPRKSTRFFPKPPIGLVCRPWLL